MKRPVVACALSLAHEAGAHRAPHDFEAVGDIAHVRTPCHTNPRADRVLLPPVSQCDCPAYAHRARVALMSLRGTECPPRTAYFPKATDPPPSVASWPNRDTQLMARGLALNDSASCTVLLSALHWWPLHTRVCSDVLARCPLPCCHSAVWCGGAPKEADEDEYRADRRDDLTGDRTVNEVCSGEYNAKGQ